MEIEEEEEVKEAVEDRCHREIELLSEDRE